MNREEKIKLLQQMGNGNNPFTAVKLDRLTNEEKLLLFRVFQQCTDEVTVSACREYYRKESNRRPDGEKPKDTPQSLTAVQDWYEQANLNYYGQRSTSNTGAAGPIR